MAVTVKTFASAVEAARALSGDRAARYMGGGTLLMRAVNDGDQSFSTLVLARDRALKEVHAHGDRLTIGAGVTLAQVLASRELDFLHPAARAVGGPAIHSMATVGGNLFAHSPYGDFATALLALDASVSLAGTAGAHDTPLADLLRNREREPRPLALALTFNRPRPGTFRFRKVTRVAPKGAPVVTIAAHLPQTGGRISGARIALGAMGPVPFRVPAAEQALEGKSLDATGIAGAVAAASAGLDPPSDSIASSWYRREVAPVHLRRLLLAS
jgi:CO/xanthine dehydrogenase FAD-binding subunit